MRTCITLFFLMVYTPMIAQQQNEQFISLPVGEVKPTGWLKKQMQHDMQGFVGNLDVIVPNLINDPIYSTARLQKNTKAKDLGNLKEGDAEGDEQYKWWNSETQSNWWDGYIRNAFLLEDEKAIEKVKQYVKHILNTQDTDGYLGIYDKELRYKFTTENGELWSKATLYRGLLAYYDYTKDERVLQSVIKAVNNVMHNYPMYNSSPFNSGTAFNGGVSHGLTFTDVLEQLYQYTKQNIYREYALFLYQDFSNTYQSEADAQLKHIMQPTYKLQAHAVHTFEHIRALIIASYTSKQAQLQQALQVYLTRIFQATTITGGAVGDEWIAERQADATHTGYEYCSLQELLHSLCLLLQKTGEASTGHAIENTFYNAAQGARHPNQSCIAYLKTDNSFEMMGTKNGEVEPNRKQTRYKYSAAHQDVAVCCNPNAGRITPYFLQHAWMKQHTNTLVATLLMPNVLQTTLQGQAVQIESVTEYPYNHSFDFRITMAKPMLFTLKIRKPSWVNRVVTNEIYTEEDGYIVIERKFTTNDVVSLSFHTDVQVKEDATGKHYFTHGALVYALPISAKEVAGKQYPNQFTDYMYKPESTCRYAFVPDAKPTYVSGKIVVQLVNNCTNQLESVELVPIGKTILRQVTF